MDEFAPQLPQPIHHPYIAPCRTGIRTNEGRSRDGEAGLFSNHVMEKWQDREQRASEALIASLVLSSFPNVVLGEYTEALCTSFLS